MQSDLILTNPRFNTEKIREGYLASVKTADGTFNGAVTHIDDCQFTIDTIYGPRCFGVDCIEELAVVPDLFTTKE